MKLKKYKDFVDDFFNLSEKMREVISSYKKDIQQNHVLKFTNPILLSKGGKIIGLDSSGRIKVENVREDYGNDINYINLHELLVVVYVLENKEYNIFKI